MKKVQLLAQMADSAAGHCLGYTPIRVANRSLW